MADRRPRRAGAAAAAFAVAADARDLLGCGVVSGDGPAFEDTPLKVIRVDTELRLTADGEWVWCIAAARIFGDGVDLVGEFAPKRGVTPAGAPLLRDARFLIEVPEFGTLGPAELLQASGYDLLRFRAAPDAASGAPFGAAIRDASTIKLRLESFAGPWTFDSVPLVDGPLAVEASSHGITFELHDLKVLSDAVATTLYTLSDDPDPGIVSFEWTAIDDLGTVYRPLPDRRVAGTLPGFYRAFAPAPPAGARRISFSISRIHLNALDQFAVDVRLR